MPLTITCGGMCGVQQRTVLQMVAAYFWLGIFTSNRMLTVPSLPRTLDPVAILVEAQRTTEGGLWGRVATASIATMAIDLRFLARSGCAATWAGQVQFRLVTRYVNMGRSFG